MSFGPACERCGANSYEGSMDRQPVVCPFCKKPKRRGSREEIISVLCQTFTVLAAVRRELRGEGVVEKAILLTSVEQVLRDIGDV